MRWAADCRVYPIAQHFGFQDEKLKQLARRVPRRTFMHPYRALAGLLTIRLCCCVRMCSAGAQNTFKTTHEHGEDDDRPCRVHAAWRSGRIDRIAHETGSGTIKEREAMTGNKHNYEGMSTDSGEPDPGPYWKRMHRDWRFWVGAVFMFAALAIYVLSGDLAWVPRGQPRQPVPAATRN
jgi:hypothetical protein